jgi:hypothetical protein
LREAVSKKKEGSYKEAGAEAFLSLFAVKFKQTMQKEVE